MERMMAEEKEPEGNWVRWPQGRAASGRAFADLVQQGAFVAGLRRDAQEKLSSARIDALIEELAVLLGVPQSDEALLPRPEGSSRWWPLSVAPGTLIHSPEAKVMLLLARILRLPDRSERPQ